MSFRASVYQVTSAIPEGRVMGYGHIAALLGSPRAARQVGFALGALDAERANPSSPRFVPWWRVLRSNGVIALKGDPIRPQLQVTLLEAEGIIVANGRVEMLLYAWWPDEVDMLGLNLSETEA